MDFRLQALHYFIARLEQELPIKIHYHTVNDGIYRIVYEDRVPIMLYIDTGKTIVLETHAIHIHLAQLQYKEQIIVDRIAALWGYATKIHARHTLGRRVSKRETLAFLEKNHLMAPLAGKYRYGLFLDEELVSIAVFSGMRKMDYEANYRSIELIRFCHKGRITVMGGLSKLIKTMIRELHPDDVMTYIDKNWSDGTKFEKIGFKSVGEKTVHGGAHQSIKMILPTKN